MSKPRQVLAMGGGGFSMEPDNPLLDQYLLSLSDRTEPRICFIPTASGDADGYTERFYKAFSQFKCQPSHLSLFRGEVGRDIHEHVLSQDIIYVGGGNTKNMLILWREYGLDQTFREAWHRGVILSGLSAGSLCWFESGVTDSIPGKMSPLRCLGILPGSNCVHYDGEADRRPIYHGLIREAALPAGYAVDDGVGLHFIDRTLHQAVSSRPQAKGYRVERDRAEVTETALPTHYLADRMEQ